MAEWVRLPILDQTSFDQGFFEGRIGNLSVLDQAKVSLLIFVCWPPYRRSTEYFMLDAKRLYFVRLSTPHCHSDNAASKANADARPASQRPQQSHTKRTPR